MRIDPLKRSFYPFLRPWTLIWDPNLEGSGGSHQWFSGAGRAVFTELLASHQCDAATALLCFGILGVHRRGGGGSAGSGTIAVQPKDFMWKGTSRAEPQENCPTGLSRGSLANECGLLFQNGQLRSADQLFPGYAWKKLGSSIEGTVAVLEHRHFEG